MWWFWFWTFFVIVFVLIPLSYGWGYRGWGPPYFRRTRSGSVVGVDPDLSEPERLEVLERADDMDVDVVGWTWAMLVVWWLLFVTAMVWFVAAVATAA